MQTFIRSMVFPLVTLAIGVGACASPTDDATSAQSAQTSTCTVKVQTGSRGLAEFSQGKTLQGTSDLVGLKKDGDYNETTLV